MTKAKDVEDYIATHKEAIDQNPECGNSHYNLAVALMGKRQFEEAERELNEALECSPGLAEAYVLLGGICMQRGDLDGCLRNNRAAVKVRPGFSEGYGNIGRYIQAFTNLANAYLMKGRIDEAIEANHKALVLAPAFAPAHNNLAIAYLEKGQYALAVAHCDKAVELGYDVAPQIRQEIEEQRANLAK
jgi:tetratricopeptide (TPR) repeat protein